jgi:hypothetical protein
VAARARPVLAFYGDDRCGAEALDPGLVGVDSGHG